MNIDEQPSEQERISRRCMTGLITGGLTVGLLGVRDASAKPVTDVAKDTEDRLAIEALLYRYALTLDNRDVDGWADCWASDKRGDFEKGMAFHRKFEHTVHNVLNHMYTIQDRTATGIQYSTVCYVKNAGGKLTKFDTYARYDDDQLVKQGDRWRFLKRKWTPIFSTAEIPVLNDVPPGFWDEPN